jgi:hypothetical protein
MAGYASQTANVPKLEGKMSKFQKSWTLMKCSFRVIFEYKKLLLFPIILSLLTIVMAVFFLAPVVLWPTGHGLADGAHRQAVARQWTVRGAGGRRIVGLSPAGYVLSAALYLLATCLATFVNVLGSSPSPPPSGCWD